jgi:hypothetical protein
MSFSCRQTLLWDASRLGTLSQSKKGPRTPSATRAAMDHRHGVSEAFLNCSQEGSGLYQPLREKGAFSAGCVSY